MSLIESEPALDSTLLPAEAESVDKNIPPDLGKLAVFEPVVVGWTTEKSKAQNEAVLQEDARGEMVAADLTGEFDVYTDRYGNIQPIILKGYLEALHDQLERDLNYVPETYRTV